MQNNVSGGCIFLFWGYIKSKSTLIWKKEWFNFKIVRVIYEKMILIIPPTFDNIFFWKLKYSKFIFFFVPY